MILEAPLEGINRERAAVRWISQTFIYGVCDGGQGRDDTLVLEINTVKLKTMLDTYGGIRDLAILHGDVEVNPN